MAPKTCTFCGECLDPAWRVQFEPSCGHWCHVSCACSCIQKGSVHSTGNEAGLVVSSDFACSTCGTLARSGIQHILAECTRNAHRQEATDLEFWITEERKLGRAITPLTAIPPLVLQLGGLRCLDFTGHPITELPSAISNLTSVSRLVLVSLYLRELPQEIGDLENLEQLFVSGCILRQVPASIERLKRLWDFYFDGNQLEELPCLPSQVDGLKISGNQLTSLPETLGRCTEMKSIRAYANSLTHLPESLCNMHRLSDVLLQGNNIAALPEEFGRARSVRYLCLHDNRLQSLPESVTEMKELRWVYLYGNQISRLPSHFIRCLPELNRLLVEGNPFAPSAAAELLCDAADIVRLGGQNLRLVGVDAMQIHGARGVLNMRERLPDGLPACIVSGWMLPWGRLYAKLSRASQFARQGDMEAHAGEAPSFGGDVLVVTFAASQGEPEWFGVLGQLLGRKGKGHSSDGSKTVAAARARIVRTPVANFADVYEELHGIPLSGADSRTVNRAGAALWFGGPGIWPHESGKWPGSTYVAPITNGRGLSDFDVLSLCDTHAQWYLDTDNNILDVERKLASIVQNYRRVLFIGTSMGGFGALSHAHLAHTVAVFGPQTDLCKSHLRPGMSREDLEAATAKLRRNVSRALEAGVRIDYHVAAEDHLLYARWLPLPRGSLVVHPVHGRIARLLESAGFLSPLLIDLLAELQIDFDGGRRPFRTSTAHASAVRSVQSAVQQACLQIGRDCSHEPLAEHFAWDWCGNVQLILVARWGQDGKLSFAWVTGEQLSLICRDPPEMGSWYCTCCWSRNEGKIQNCRCGGVPDQDARRCMFCNMNKLYGHEDSVAGLWYCDECWKKYEAYNRELKGELSGHWFVEGGQRWAWANSERHGYIEFSTRGGLSTSWGRGSWMLRGKDMMVTFGTPPRTKCLRRTAKGFRCISAGDDWRTAAVVGFSSCAEGWPLNGVPSSISNGALGGILREGLVRVIATLMLKIHEASVTWVRKPRAAFFVAMASAISALLMHRRRQTSHLRAA